MKQIRKFSFRRVIAAFSVAALLFGSGCTRDDADNVLGKGADGPIRFQVNTASALTKGGSANAVEHLGSTLFDVVDGNELYLSLESTPWEVDAAATKVAPYKDKGDLTSVSFGMAVYKQDSETSAVSSWQLHGGPVEAPYVGSYWEPTTPILWPNLGKKVHFFVYAPYNSSLTMSAATGTEPTLAGFVVSDAAASQKDLLYARDVTDDSNPLILNGGGAMEAYKITFEHALAAIRFKVIESAGITVTSVKVRGVYDGGTLNMNTGEWTGLSKSGNTITITAPSTTSDGNGYALFNEQYTLMMIPNISGDDNRYTAFEGGAEIEVNYTKGGVNKTTTTPITSHQWKQGYMLTYVIGDYDDDAIHIYDYFFSVAEQPTLDYTGKLSDNGKIISYKQLKSDPSQQTAVGWSIDGYYNTLSGAQNGTISDRIAKGAAGTFIKDFIPEVGNGSITGEQVKISYPGAEYTEREDIDTGTPKDQIIAATPKKERQGGKAYNLSNPADPYSDVVMNTANTYIINGAGYYRFPIVMGNGVKNGALNPDAYTQTGFVDYKDRPITDPYLRGTTPEEVPTTAMLCFEDKPYANKIINVIDGTKPYFFRPGADHSAYYLDFPNAVNGITKTTDAIGDVYWVNFHVESATKQGFSTITVRNPAGNLMWTWLIWLTDLKLGEGDIAAKALKNSQDETQGRLEISFMNRPLGWVDDATKTIYKYPAATPAYMRLIQNESGEVAVVELKRPAANFEEQTMGHAPYYQWGRNVHIPPLNGKIGSTAERLTSENGGYFRERYIATDRMTIGEAIRNSAYFITTTNGGDWCTTNFINLWNADETTAYGQTETTDTPVKKTIYDPSPVGYTVPRRNAFTAFYQGYPTVVDSYGNQYASPNTKSVDNGRGWTLYTEWRAKGATPTGGEIYLPGLGYIAGRTNTPATQGSAAIFVTAGGSLVNSVFFEMLRASSTTRVFPYYVSHKVTAIPILPQREE